MNLRRALPLLIILASFMMAGFAGRGQPGNATALPAQQSESSAKTEYSV
jgi:hypothetical protein